METKITSRGAITENFLRKSSSSPEPFPNYVGADFQRSSNQGGIGLLGAFPKRKEGSCTLNFRNKGPIRRSIRIFGNPMLPCLEITLDHNNYST
ncbi:hypothetical protein B5X24_HaOG209975 [Helicoverpa armigera]|uniref:Uncharacterized protein n=1 Tax=Helicoverpa armigera TaxID=29058 RepID=A0A2W1BFU2_HELAM|nr:hypothetical protein B5X24_HaOG209975 [Helicoverpa armigera]